MYLTVLLKTLPLTSLKNWVCSAFLGITFIALSSCSSPESNIVEVTRVVPQTVIVKEIVTQIITEVVEIVVTATPQPATHTPEATPTSEFQRWTSMDVVDVFITSGLEVEGTRPMTIDDYGPAPMTAVEGTRFLIPSLCADCGGRIFSFSSPQDLELLKHYYIELGKSSAWFFSWVFEKDNILVQINGELSEEKANQYEDAVLGLE